MRALTEKCLKNASELQLIGEVPWRLRGAGTSVAWSKRRKPTISFHRMPFRFFDSSIKVGAARDVPQTPNPSAALRHGAERFNSSIVPCDETGVIKLGAVVK
jgi:hypothetical protein